MKMNKNATNEISERSIRSQLNSRFGIKGKQTNNKQTRNIFSKRLQRGVFRSQEKVEDNHLRLIDVEKFLLKVTSKRQANTPSTGADRNTHLSYIPPCVIKKCTESNIKKEHINILTGIKKKVSFFNSTNIDIRSSNLKSVAHSNIPATIKISEGWKNFLDHHNSNKMAPSSHQFLHLPHLYNYRKSLCRNTPKLQKIQ